MYGSYRITPSCIAKAPYELRREIEQALRGLKGAAA